MKHIKIVKAFNTIEVYMESAFMDDNDKQRIIDELTTAYKQILKYQEEQRKV